MKNADLQRRKQNGFHAKEQQTIARMAWKVCEAAARIPDKAQERHLWRMRRTKEIKVRMTEKEFDRVTALAQATVLSREEFIREALRGTTIRQRPPAEYGEIVRELRGIGSNVHQLLLKARTLDDVDEIMLQETIDTIRHMDRVFTVSFA